MDEKNYPKQHRYERALADINKAISIHPTIRSYYLTRALIYNKMGRNKLYKEDLKRAKE